MGFSLKKFAGTILGVGVAVYTGGLSLATVGTGAFIGSQIDQIRASGDLADAANQNAAEQTRLAERAYQAEKQRADIQNIRNIRSSIRQARIAAGSMQNLGFQTGGAGSSGLAGGVSSVQSQLAGNVNYAGTMSAYGNQISQANLGMAQSSARYASASADAQQTMAIAGTIGNTIGTIFGPVGLSEGFDKISAGFKTKFG